MRYLIRNLPQPSPSSGVKRACRSRIRAFDPCLCYEIRRVGPEASAELRPGGRVLRQVSNQDSV